MGVRRFLAGVLIAAPARPRRIAPPGRLPRGPARFPALAHRSGANHTAAVALAASFNKTAPEKLDWAFTHADPYRDPKGLPDVKALQSNLGMMADLGFVKEHVAVDRYLDLSLVKEAASRIKLIDARGRRI